MIVKKAKCKKVKAKHQHIRDLLRYINGLKNTSNSHSKTGEEKVLFSGAFNFFSDSLAGQIGEMSGLANEAVHSDNPINHWILSWPKNESPTRAQIEDCVKMLLKEFGLEDHQTAFAAHQDTENLHVHIVINRVSPDTGRPIEINRGYDIKVAHRAVAKMEYKHGFTSCKNSMYKINSVGQVEPSLKSESDIKKVTSTVSDFEAHTNEKSKMRTGIEKSSEIFKSVKNWEELHFELQKKNMFYEKKGSGAVIKVDEIYCKASSISQLASLKKLEDRLGPFVPPAPTPAPTQAPTPAPTEAAVKKLDEMEQYFADLVAQMNSNSGPKLILEPDPEPKPIPEPDPTPEPMKHSPLWSSYIKQKDIYFEKKQTARKSIEDKYQTKSDLIQNFKRDRYKFFANQSWRGRGYLLSALKIEVASEVKQQKLLMSVQKKAEMGEFYKKFEAYPRFEEWEQVWHFNVERYMKMKNQTDESDVLILEDRRPRIVKKMPTNEQENALEFLKFFDRLQTQEDLKKVEALAYDQAKKRGLTVENFNYLGKGFYDAGTKVVVNSRMEKQEDNVMQALEYAAKKFGNSLHITGDDIFKIAAAKIAVKLGIEIQNAELQAVVTQQKRLLALERDLKNVAKNEQKLVDKQEPKNGFSAAPVAPLVPLYVESSNDVQEPEERDSDSESGPKI